MVAWALKEWDVAVAALLQGDTVLLLRKGGLREQSGQFTLAARKVLLLPTFEHQDAALLKPSYQAQVKSAPSLGEGDPVSFPGWAEITQAFLLPPATDLKPLLPELIGNQRFLQGRLQWQPSRPLHGLVLRAFQCKPPQQLPWQPAYRGCRSWVQLGQNLAVDRDHPALPDSLYQQRVEKILAALPASARILDPDLDLD